MACKDCKDNNISKGVGDSLANLIDTFTMGMVKPCGGCKKRQEKLNHWMPYKK